MMRSLLHDLPLKLLSLAIAVILWIVIVGDPEMMTSVSAPIQYTNLPRDLEIASEIPESVHLEIRGPASKLASVLEERTAVVLDLASQAHPGERTFTIRQLDVNLPAGVSLARVVPAQLRLRFERREERDVPVQVRFAGPPPAGYRVSRTEVSPERRTITGPESRVNRIEFVETDQIDLSSVVSEEEFHVYCNTADPLVTFDDTRMVSVKVWMEKIPAKAEDDAKKAVRN
jgi:YbbR domain-containing protein